MMFSRSLRTTIVICFFLGIALLLLARWLHLDTLSLDEVLDKSADKWEQKENAHMNNIVLSSTITPPPTPKNALSDENVVVTNT